MQSFTRPKANFKPFKIGEPLTKQEIKSGISVPVWRGLTEAQMKNSINWLFRLSLNERVNWGGWYEENDTLQEERGISPWFNEHYSGYEGRAVITDDRIHVRYATWSAPQTIIHLERRVREGFEPEESDEGQIYHGYELMSASKLSSRNDVMIGATTDSGYEHVTRTNRSLWLPLSGIVFASTAELIQNVTQESATQVAAS